MHCVIICLFKSMKSEVIDLEFKQKQRTPKKMTNVMVIISKDENRNLLASNENPL